MAVHYDVEIHELRSARYTSFKDHISTNDSLASHKEEPSKEDRKIFKELELSDEFLQLQYPHPSEVHTTDEADAMQRRLNSVFSKPKSTGPFEDIPIIGESGLARNLQWKEKVKNAVKCNSHGLWQQAQQKARDDGINETDAVFVVYADRIIKKQQGNVDEALFWVVVKMTTEFCAELLVVILLQQGASPSFQDQDSKNTPLHYAAKKGWASIAKRLMEHENTAYFLNKERLIPLELAIKNDRNECATFLVKSMKPASVRALFEVPDDCGANEEANSDEATQTSPRTTPMTGMIEQTNCKLKFHSLLEKPNMQTTVLAVLDTMMEPVEGNPECYMVYYNILEGDENGHDPKNPKFNDSEKSCLYKITKKDNKEVIYHRVVRLLIKHKWEKFARFSLLAKFVYFSFNTIIMTLALVLAAKKPDPRDYNEGVDKFRGICEVVLFLCILYNVFTEVYQFKRHCKEYFTDFFNYLDIGAILFTLLITPFRIINSPAQWTFASLGCLCQTLRGFGFAAVFKSTGVYIQILPRIIIRDMVPFGVVFSLFLFAFTSAFYFSLRGEEFTIAIVTASNCSSKTDNGNCVENVITKKSSSLDTFPYMAKEYYKVLFTNLRIMIESQGILDEYYGPHGLRWLSIILYIVFLFLVITVMLNLLIAQMSDTYTNEQDDAQRSFVINRAWIVAKLENNSLIASALLNCRKRNYRAFELIKNPYDQLDQWKPSSISYACTELITVRGLLRQHRLATLENFKLMNEELVKLRNTMLGAVRELDESIMRRTRENNK